MDTSYEDKWYTFGGTPDYGKSKRLDVKVRLDLDFSNLPYLMDHKNKITQRNATLLACKHNMCGGTEEEKIQADLMEKQIMDFLMQLITILLQP
uniref:Uncharacterized protein n=1 Tax=Catagonus wagneri TaxID=51154 RepID=A0A8C3VVM4_9CETA